MEIMDRSDQEITEGLREAFYRLNWLLDRAYKARLDIGITVNRSVNHEETTTDRVSLDYSIKKNILP